MANTKKSIERLLWRFREQKAFLPNENDITALNEIVEFYNAQTNSIAASQEPFAKLYIYLYRSLLKKFDFTVFDKMPQRLLMDQLQKTLIDHITDLTFDLNTSEMYMTMDKMGYDLDGKQNDEQNIAILSTNAGAKAIIDKSFDYEFVSKAIISQVNEVIDTVNHPKYK